MQQPIHRHSALGDVHLLCSVCDECVHALSITELTTSPPSHYKCENCGSSNALNQQMITIALAMVLQQTIQRVQQLEAGFVITGTQSQNN